MTLGSIVVRLTMNTADFDTDSKRAASIAEKRAKEIDASFRKAGVAIGLALGAIAVGITSALKGAIDTMDETYNAAKKVGDSTENFSRLVYAAGLADLGMDQLVTTMGRLTKSQAAALDVGSAQGKMFKALGIEVTDTTGKLRGSTEVLLDFADKFEAANGSPELMAAGFALFGRSFQDLIPLLEQGSDEIRRLMKEADDLGVTLSDKAGANADRARDQFDKMQLSIGGVWKDIAAGLLPNLEEAAKRLTVMASDGDLARNATTLLSTALNFGVGALEAYNTAVGYTSILFERLARQGPAVIEMMSNLGTMGLFRDGSVAGGWDEFKKAGEDATKQWDRLKADNELRKAGMTRDQYTSNLMGQFTAGIPGMNKSTFPEMPFNFATYGQKPRAGGDPSKAVRDMLGAPTGGAKGGGKSKAAELTDEQKAAKALNEEYTRTAEGLRERLGLMGLETEAAKMKWETEEGSFKALDPMRKAELIAQAALVDAKKTAMELAEDERRANEDAQKSYQAAIADIQMERDTLGMTNEQLEIYNALKWAGVDANSAFGKSLTSEMQQMQDARKAMGAQIEAMDAFRAEGSNFLQDIGNGADPIDSFIGALDRLRAKLLQMIADNLMEQLFGQMGSAGGGSGGGWLASLAGMFGGLFGGGSGAAAAGGGSSMFDWIGNGYARGGWTGPGATNQPAGIVHADEVVWSKGDVARAGGVAQVETMRRGGAAVSSEAKRPLVVFNEAQMLDALAAHGGLEKVVVHYMERNRDRMRANI